MTWAEFKRWMEERGVKDETRIGYIDFDGEPDRVYFDSRGGRLPEPEACVL